MSVALLVASSDDQVRDVVRDNLLNISGARVAAEYSEVGPNLYIRVLQDLDRNPEAALIIDLGGDREAALKALEKTKKAAPGLYVLATDFSTEGELVIAALRAGANDFIGQPLKRVEFREAVSRIESAPRSTVPMQSRLGKVYSFLGCKGGVGATTLAVNFASVLAQRKSNVVLIDLDWCSNDCCMQIGAAPQYTLHEVGENMDRMDRSLFEGFIARDPLGFFVVGPPDSLDQKPYFTEPMLREFLTFLVEHYDAVVIDAGKNIQDEVALAALQSSSTVFLTLDQRFPAVRNAQRYMAALTHLGFNQDQVRIVVNHYTKKPSSSMATLEQIQGTMNQQVFYGIPASPFVLNMVNKARPFVTDRQSAPELDRAFRAFVDKATGVKREAAAQAS